jgi:hypothetical protein
MSQERVLASTNSNYEIAFQGKLRLVAAAALCHVMAAMLLLWLFAHVADWLDQRVTPSKEQGWGQITIGMTKAEVINILGVPDAAGFITRKSDGRFYHRTASFDVTDGGWYLNHYQFVNISFDEEGLVIHKDHPIQYGPKHPTFARIEEFVRSLR